jgi:hypothetical protein
MKNEGNFVCFVRYSLGVLCVFCILLFKEYRKHKEQREEIRAKGTKI